MLLWLIWLLALVHFTWYLTLEFVCLRLNVRLVGLTLDIVLLLSFDCCLLLVFVVCLLRFLVFW